MGTSGDASRVAGPRDWLRAIEPIAVIALVGVFLLVIDVGCPFRFLFGVSCPGCGMTRAWLAFLTGDVGRAFAMNPLFWAPVVAIPLFELAPKLGHWALVVAFGLCIAVIGLWALRMGLATGLFDLPWAGALDPGVVAIGSPGFLEWARFFG